MQDKFWKLIKELIDIGVVIELHKDKDKLTADLQTGMKSHCYLVEGEDKIVAEMRYDQSVEVNSVEDVLDAVRSCMHGKTYLSSHWLDILNRVGFWV